MYIGYESTHIIAGGTTKDLIFTAPVGSRVNGH